MFSKTKNKRISKYLSIPISILGLFLAVHFASAAFSTPTLRATPSSINPGNTVTLTWTWDTVPTAASVVSITINPGAVRVGINGSITVTPAVTTTYTMRAEFTGGVVNSSAPVTVTVSRVASTPNGWGRCSDPGFFDKASCEVQGGTWTPDRVLTSANLARAQTDENYCLNGFKADVFDITKKSFKTIWFDFTDSGTDMGIGNCVIVSAGFDDNGDPSSRSIAAETLQEQIRLSPVGISETQVAEAIAQEEINSNEGAWWSKILGYVLTAVASLINGILMLLIGIIWKIMIAAINASVGFGDSLPAIVLIGWTIIRDIMNMIFVLAMIVMSLATILQIEEYSWKKILPKLIIMAVLINFSLVIATSIISVFDLLINIFIPAEGWKDITVTMLGIIGDGFWAAEAGVGSALVSSVASIIFFVIMIVVTLALTILFVVRMVGLYILVIFSPIAYALYVLPATQEYAKKWWTTFIKYLIWGPVGVFFLWLTLRLAEDGGLSGIGVTNSAFSFVILSGFLAAGVVVAQQAGMIGSEAVVSMADKTVKGAAGTPFKGAWMGTKALTNLGAETVLQRFGKEIRPKKWIEGWTESRDINRAKREEEGMLQAEGRSVAANPTAFFQRYWSKQGVGKVLTKANKRGKKLFERALNDDKLAQVAEAEATQRDAYAAAATNPVAKAMNENQAKAARKQALDYRLQASQKRAEARELVYDPDYFTQRKTREAVNHEKTAILGETWQELFDLAEGAHREKHAGRYLALFEKLAETYNENELITHTRYSRGMDAKDSAEWEDPEQRAAIIKRAIAAKVDASKARSGDFEVHKAGEFFSEDADGIENFRKQILVTDMEMSDQASMRFMADIGEIANAHNHTGIWRLYNTKDGKYRRNPYEDWSAEMRIEKGKMDAGLKLTRFNRLAGHDEYTSPNYEADETRISITQENEIEDTINLLDNVKFTLGRGTFVASKAKALAFKPNIERLKHYAKTHLDDTPTKSHKALDLKNSQLMTFTGKSGVAGHWTRREEALWTIDQLEKYGKEQYTGDEYDRHEEIFEELLKNNKISERHRKYIRDAGLTTFRGETV